LPVPLSVLYGADDDLIDRACITEWAALSTAGTVFSECPGGHFFLDQHYGVLLGELRAEAMARRRRR
jgi:surfactin synthase thioesterase subunit